MPDASTVALQTPPDGVTGVHMVLTSNNKPVAVNTTASVAEIGSTAAASSNAALLAKTTGSVADIVVVDVSAADEPNITGSVAVIAKLLASVRLEVLAKTTGSVALVCDVDVNAAVAANNTAMVPDNAPAGSVPLPTARSFHKDHAASQ